MQAPLRPLTRADRVAQVLVLIGVIGVIGSPAGWFGVGELNDLHLGSAEWHAHGKFHLMWQGVSYWLLGGAALAAALRPRSPVFRWIGAGVPLSVFTAYFAVMLFVAPALGVPDPVAHYAPNEYGVRSNVLWITIILLSTASGLLLNLRAARRQGGPGAASGLTAPQPT